MNFLTSKEVKKTLNVFKKNTQTLNVFQVCMGTLSIYDNPRYQGSANALKARWALLSLCLQWAKAMQNVWLLTSGQDMHLLAPNMDDALQVFGPHQCASCPNFDLHSSLSLLTMCEARSSEHLSCSILELPWFVIPGVSGVGNSATYYQFFLHNLGNV